MGGLRELHLRISSRKKLYNQTTGFWSSKVGYTAGNLGRANLSTTLALLSGVCEQLLMSYSDFSDPRADTSLWKVSRNRASAEDTAAGWDQGCIPISKAYRSSWNIVDITKNWNQRLWFWPFIWASTSLLRRKLNTAPLWKFPSDIEAYLCVKEIKAGRQVLEKELGTGNVLRSPILEPRIWPRCRSQSVVVNSVSWSLCPESTEGCGSPLTDSKAVLKKEDCLGCPHFLWLCWFFSHKTKQKLPLLIEEWMNKTCYKCTMDFFIQKNKIMSFSKR